MNKMVRACAQRERDSFFMLAKLVRNGEATQKRPLNLSGNSVSLNQGNITSA